MESVVEQYVSNTIALDYVMEIVKIFTDEVELNLHEIVPSLPHMSDGDLLNLYIMLFCMSLMLY